MQKIIKILVIDDSIDDTELLIRHLKKDGWQIEFHRIDTEPALVKALTSNWDIVLSDYNMPNLTLERTLEVLQSDPYRDLPLIIISGALGEETAVGLIRRGASDFLLKDRLTRLSAVIERELDAAKSRAYGRATEKALRETEDQLRHVQKMEAIGQLAGGVAHDFNNMLSVIQIYCKKIQAFSHPTINTYIERILGVQARSVELTRKLLIFSRRQSLQPQNLDLSVVVHGMSDMIKRLLGDAIDLKIDSEMNLKNIFADQGSLEQLLMNLCINSRDAMPKGGTLTISCKALDLQNTLVTKTSHLLPGEFILLEVTDTGCGMTPEIIEKIFDPFFTTKAIGQGTGLGLSIVYGIVHQIHGGITVVSKPGSGTTFQFYFPVSKVTKMPKLTIPNVKKVKGKNETVLLVEDEKELLLLFTEILQENGYNVIPASNGHIAYSILEESKVKIDVVITDIMMPILTGYDLRTKAKQSNHQEKFIFMSGQLGDQLQENEWYNESIFLEKPFTDESLLQKIRYVLDSEPLADSVKSIEN